jgi:hypothetical protein
MAMFLTKCRGGCGRMISNRAYWRRMPKGTLTYQSQGVCRKCARKARHMMTHKGRPTGRSRGVHEPAHT